MRKDARKCDDRDNLARREQRAHGVPLRGGKGVRKTPNAADTDPVRYENGPGDS